MKKFKFKISLPFIIKSIAVISLLLIVFTAYSYGKKAGFGSEVFIKRNYEYTEKGGEKIINSLVEDITVNWNCGDIEIKERIGTTVNVYEISSEKLGEKEFMKTTLEGTELTIEWNEEGKSASKNLGKKLVIELPYGAKLDSLTVRGGDSDIVLNKITSYDISVSTGLGTVVFGKVEAGDASFTASNGGVKGENSKFENLKVRSTEGDIILENFNAYSLNTFTSEGKTLFTGDFCELKAKSFRGDITMETKYRPKDINVSSTYGNIELFLPSNLSAKGEYKTIGGNFVTDYKFKTEEPGVIKLNAEEYELNLISTNGNITMKSGERGIPNAYFSKLLGEDEE